VIAIIVAFRIAGIDELSLDDPVIHKFLNIKGKDWSGPVKDVLDYCTFRHVNVKVRLFKYGEMKIFKVENPVWDSNWPCVSFDGFDGHIEATPRNFLC
jgi:hypothetical protein